MKLLNWMTVLTLFAALQGCSMDAASVREAKDPMPLFARNSRILFTGDSITDGNRGRNADLNHIMGHGYQAEVAARFGADLYDRNLLFMNRGVSGDTVAGLQRRIQKDLIDLKPDVLSILIGVNDMGRTNAEQWEQSYDQFLSNVTTALPNVRLILGEPFGLPVGGKKANWENYHVQLEARQAIVARLATKYHAAIIHYQKMFDEAAKRAPADYWIWDGVHPTISGHQLMADEWVRVAREHWPQGSVPPLLIAAPAATQANATGN